MAGNVVGKVGSVVGKVGSVVEVRLGMLGIPLAARLGRIGELLGV